MTKTQLISFLPVFIGALLVPAPGFAASAGSEAVWNVSGRKQLFIDHRFIAASSNVQLVANPPRLAGPALEPGPPGAWDDGEVASGQVLEDQGIFKMWAVGFAAKSLKGDWQELEVHMPMGYATSKDGIHWTKPKLGIFEWEGSKANNITCLDLGYVTIDPHGKKEERYKMLCAGATHIGARKVYDALLPQSSGLYFYTSPDGLHWTWHPQRVLPFHPDTLNQMDYDARLGKYVAYLRSWPNGFLFGKNYGRTVARVELDDPLAPWPYDASAKPVKPWGPKYIPTVGQEIPTVISYPGYTNQGVWTDVYNPCVSVYPWAEDVYLAFPSLNHYLAESKLPNDSRLNIGMVTSRDGIEWQWPTTEPYIPYGAPGSGRSGQLYNLVGMVKVGSELFQYHCATDRGHNVDPNKAISLEQLRNVGRIFRTVQRLDGFVSADFSPGGGELTTPRLKFSGSKLHLNLNAKGGSGQVEVLNETGTPIPGFELAACKPIKSDSVDQLVAWKRGGDLSRLKGQTIRLRFQMRGVKLYAFQFTK